MPTLRNIGHRGAKGHWAENTIESFQKAFDMGAHGIELDVHLSKDGRIVVIHDESIDRTTNGQGLVLNMSLEVLQTYLIDQRFRIPELGQTLDALQGRGLINIELKTAETAAPVADMIDRYVRDGRYAYRDFIISSFDWVALQKLRERGTSIPLGVLTPVDLELAVGFAQSIQAETIHPYFHLLDADNVRHMQSQNLKVYTWTVNEFEDLQRLKTFGVDAIITDFPDRL